MIEVPRAFADVRIRETGDAGRRWVDSLPDVVEGLLHEWRLECDGDPMHGFTALVVPVRRDDELLALKVAWPHLEGTDEPLALRTWNGDGAVRLFEWDADRSATLLERLDPSRCLKDEPVEVALATIAELLRRTTVPAPDAMHAADLFIESVRSSIVRAERLAHPALAQSRLNKALALLESLPLAASTITNTDLHFENVLAATREPWLVIDPKPFRGLPELAVCQIVLGCPIDTDWVRSIETICDIAQLDRAVATAWTYVRSVDMLHWLLAYGFTDMQAISMAVIDALEPLV
jgi:streptomycin 6-kinase